MSLKESSNTSLKSSLETIEKEARSSLLKFDTDAGYDNSDHEAALLPKFFIPDGDVKKNYSNGIELLKSL